MRLTQQSVRGAKPAAKSYRLSDGQGLYLDVRPSGRKTWLVRVRDRDRDTFRTLGTFPEITLKDARKRAISVLAEDPKNARSKPLRDVAREWLKAQTHIAASTRKQREDRLEHYAMKQLGDRPVSEIRAPEIVEALHRGVSEAPLMPHQTGAEQQHRVRADLDRVFRFAIASGYCEQNPASAVKDALLKAAPKNYKAVPVERLADFLFALDAYPGDVALVEALRFQLLTLSRPGMVRLMPWSELDGEMWRISADRMKKGRDHIVPLSRQALEVLERMRELTGEEGLVFRGHNGLAYSENAQRNAIHRMGFKATAHGLRATASTALQELGYEEELIKMALSHGKDKTTAAYLRSPLVRARREMLQVFADHLDSLTAPDS